MTTVVLVIAGFLGSGKTTFMQKLLQKNILVPPVTILINDFGEQVLDTPLLTGHGNSIQELPAGCICCSSTEEFRDFLQHIPLQEGGTLLIEATGLADIATLRWEMSVAGVMPDTVFCVIDPNIYVSLKDAVPSVARQPAFADVICLAKTDIAQSEIIAQCTDELTKKFPLTPMIPLHKGTCPSAELLPYIIPESHIVAEQPHTPELPLHYHEHFHIQQLTWQGIIPIAKVRTILEHLPPELIRLKARIPVINESGELQYYLAQKTLSGYNIMPLPTTSTEHSQNAMCMIIDKNVNIITESVNIITKLLPTTISMLQIQNAKAEKKEA